MEKKDCLFCKIIKGDIPSRKIFESNNTLAFLDIAPKREGHVVLIPKKHYYNLLDIPEEEINPFFKDLKEVASIVKEKMNAEGFNIVQNNFPAAGQLVPHFHYHIIPRNKEDRTSKKNIPPKMASKSELDRVFEKFK